MDVFQLKIAGIVIQVKALYDVQQKFCENWISDGQPDFRIEMNEKDIAEERRKSMAEYAHEGLPYPDFSPPELENTAIYRKIAKRLPDYGKLVFHGAAVAVNGRSVIFTAKSGTGKTTHANLWLKNIPGAEIVNGDKPVIGCSENGVTVFGTPWMGKERLGSNTSAAVSAICVIKRGKENRLRKMAFSEVMPMLIGQSYRPPEREGIAKTLSLIEKIGKQVAFYELTCNISDEAALMAYRGIFHEEQF